MPIAPTERHRSKAPKHRTRWRGSRRAKQAGETGSSKTTQLGKGVTPTEAKRTGTNPRTLQQRSSPFCGATVYADRARGLAFRLGWRLADITAASFRTSRHRKPSRALSPRTTEPPLTQPPAARTSTPVMAWIGYLTCERNCPCRNICRRPWPGSAISPASATPATRTSTSARHSDDGGTCKRDTSCPDQHGHTAQTRRGNHANRGKWSASQQALVAPHCPMDASPSPTWPSNRPVRPASTREYGQRLSYDPAEGGTPSTNPGACADAGSSTPQCRYAPHAPGTMGV